MNRHLILVKHSLPEIEADRPRREWRLSSSGRERCGSLAARLVTFGVERVWASPEPKAYDTAATLVTALRLSPVETIDGLREQDDTGVPFAGEPAFRAGVAAFFDRPAEAVFGRETADMAHARFAAAIRALPDPANGAAHVAVSHGRVITLFVSRQESLDPMTLWAQLGLPSFVVLRLPDYRVLEIVGTI